MFSPVSFPLLHPISTGDGWTYLRCAGCDGRGGDEETPRCTGCDGTGHEALPIPTPDEIAAAHVANDLLYAEGYWVKRPDTNAVVPALMVRDAVEDAVKFHDWTGNTRVAELLTAHLSRWAEILDR